MGWSSTHFVTLVITGRHLQQDLREGSIVCTRCLGRISTSVFDWLTGSCHREIDALDRYIRLVLELSVYPCFLDPSLLGDTFLGGVIFARLSPLEPSLLLFGRDIHVCMYQHTRACGLTDGPRIYAQATSHSQRHTVAVAPFLVVVLRVLFLFVSGKTPGVYRDQIQVKRGACVCFYI